MDLTKASNFMLSSPSSTTTTFSFIPLSPTKFYFHFCPNPFPRIPIKPLTLRATRNTSYDSDPIPESTIVQEVSFDKEEDDGDDLLDDDASLDVEDDGYEDDDYEVEEEEYVGDGGAGGGVSLAGTWWDKKALAIAREVTTSFDGDLQIYAFRTLVNSTIQVRIEKLSNKSGSPSMEDIEAFSTTYRAKLDEAEVAKFVPENLYLEVSSPGVERIVRIPNDLDRFKDRPMYVKYAIVDDSNNPSREGDGIFKLESFDMETKCCTWGIADVKVNRGKGRPLNKKQREWRLSTPFDSLLLVRIHSDC
ncbi:hypothetical protein Lal_00002026 [Lupinus albus]|uniref:Putative ribosome maturation factor RimP n=1 Tax=Lupinus albus TaxID=3870 RepID=A0A6A4PRT7_LUPAL|nr:putative ribosome maturation factor RimP [Lupinus albus]KAF1893536.1 hypothetical protein Lal_00002026 [Lupinus albus]